MATHYLRMLKRVSKNAYAGYPLAMTCAMAALLSPSSRAHASPTAAMYFSGTGAVKVVDIGSNTLTHSIGVTGIGELALSGTAMYVLDSVSNTVQIIDTNLQSVVKVVPVGLFPTGLAVAGTGVYVANFNADSLSVIDTTTQNVVNTYGSIGLSPNQVAVAGTGVYVSCYGGSNVRVFDTTSQTATLSITAGIGPQGMALVGTGMYVANEMSNSVSVINTVTHAVDSTLSTGFAGPMRIAQGRTGLYVTNNASGANSVTLIDVPKMAVSKTIAVGSNPLGLALAGTGMYVVNSTDGTAPAQIIDITTNTVSNAIALGGTAFFPAFNIPYTPIVWQGASGASWESWSNWVPLHVPAVGETATFLSSPAPFASPANAVPVLINSLNPVTTISFENGSTGSYYHLVGSGAIVATAAAGGTASIIATSSNLIDNVISAPIQLQTGLHLDNQASGTMTLGGIISGNYALSKTGVGAAVLGGTNTYVAGTFLQGGTLSLNHNLALGSSALTMSPGTELDLLSGMQSASNRLSLLGTATINVFGLTGATLSGVISGTGPLVKVGDQRLILGGTSTYTAGTFLQGGTLGLNHNLALGTSALTMSPGTQLDLLSSLQSASNPISLLGTGTINVSGVTGATLSGVVSGTGPLLKTGVGRLILGGTNTYTAGTFLQGGTLGLNHDAALGASALTMSAGTQLDLLSLMQSASNPISFLGTATIDVSGLTGATLSGVVSGTGPLLKTGAGRLILGGTNAYTAGTFLQGGTLGLNHDAALGASALTMSAGTQLDLLSLVQNMSNPISCLGTATIGVSGITGATLSGVISGTGPLVKTEAGRLILGGTNTYTAGTFLQGGTLGLNNDSALGAGGILTMSAGTQLDLLSGLASQLISNPIVLFGNATVDVSNVTGATLSGVISGNGPLVKVGAERLILSGANTYPAGTFLQGGTLGLNNNTALGDGMVTMSPDTQLDLLSAVQSVSNTISLVGTATIDVSSVTGATLSGVVSGIGPLVKVGGQRLILSGANIYTEGTFLEGGTLGLNHNLALGTSALTMSPGTELDLLSLVQSASNPISLLGTATIDVSAVTGATLSGVVSGTGPLLKTGTGRLILGGTNAYTAGTFLQGGTLGLNHDAALGTSALTMSAGTQLDLLSLMQSASNPISFLGTATINVPGVTGATLSGALSGTGPLLKTGAGQLILGGTNAYTAGTFLQGGTLGLNHDAALGASALTMSAGTQLDLLSLVQSASNPISFLGTATIGVSGITGATLSGALSGVGPLVKLGAQRLILGGTNTYGAGTFLQGGTLGLTNDSALGIGGTLTMSAGTQLDLLSGMASQLITNPIVLLGGANVNVSGITGATLAGVISGTGPLFKVGTDTLILGGTNTYTAGTFLQGGTLGLNHNAGLGAGALTMSAGTQLDLLSALQSVSNPISLLGTATIDVSSLTGATLSGVVSGTGALFKTGTGRLILGGSNTYTAGTFLQGGTLGLNNNLALGAGGTLTIDAGRELTLMAGVQNISNPISMLGTATVDVLGVTGATLSGVVSGTGPLLKTGVGRLILGATNTYTAGTFLQGGTLGLNNHSALGSSALTMAPGTELDLLSAVQSISNPISFLGTATIDVFGVTGATLSGIISGTGPLLKTGAPRLILGGTNTYGAGTFLQGGTLGVNNDSALGVGGTLTMSAGTQLDLLSGMTTQLVSNPIVLLGSGAVDVSGVTGATLSGIISGTGPLVKVGAHRLVLGGTNTYGAGTFLQGGTLGLSNDSGLGVGGTLTMSAGTQLELLSGMTTQLVSNPIVLLGGANIDVSGITGATLSGVISGTGPLFKVGAHRLILGAANTYTAGTFLQGGTLGLNNNAALGAGTLTMAVGTELDLLSGMQSASNPISLLGTATIDVSGVTGATLSGIISGTGPLFKTGGARLILGGTNTYTAGTFLQGGTLGLNNNSALGGSSLTMAPGTELDLFSAVQSISNPISLLGTATIDVSGITGATLSGVVSGTGPLLKTGVGRLILGATNTYTAGTFLQGGTLGLNNNSALGSSALTMAPGTELDLLSSMQSASNPISLLGTATIDVSGITGATLSGIISGTGPLLKTGARRLILGGTNTYGAGTFLQGGTLGVNNDSALGVGGTLTMSTGTQLDLLSGMNTQLVSNPIVLLGSGAVDVSGVTGATLSGIISGTGPLVKVGAHRLVLGGTNTYGAGTFLQGGTLGLSNDSGLGVGGTLTMSAGTQLELLSGMTTQLVSNPIVLLGSGNIDVSGITGATLSGVISGTGPLFKVGAHRLILGAANTYTAGTFLQGGTLGLNNNAALGAGTLTMAVGTELDLLSGMQSASNALSLLGIATVNVPGGSGATLSGVISGTGPLFKTGEGRLILGGTNTYGSGTFLQGGTLGISHNSALGIGSTLTMSADTELDLLSGMTNAIHPIALLGTATIDVIGVTGATLSGVVSGLGPLVKVGAQRLILAGANTYTAGTFLQGGTLGLNNNVALGSSALTMSSGTELDLLSSMQSASNPISLLGTATIDVSSVTGATLSGIVSGTGPLFKTGTGRLILGGTNTYGAGTFLQGGTLGLNNDSALGVGGTLTMSAATELDLLSGMGSQSVTNPIVLLGSGAVDVSNVSGATLSGVISGNGPLLKVGTDRLILGGTNTYTAGTFLQGGTLGLNNDSGLGVGGTLTMSSGTELDLLSGMISQVVSNPIVLLGTGIVDVSAVAGGTLSGIISGTGPLYKQGDGLLVLGGTNTYRAGTFLQGGTLGLNNDAALGASGGTVTMLGGTEVDLLTGMVSPVVYNPFSFLGTAGINVSAVGQGALAGVISGVGALQKGATGLLILSGTNRYHGGTLLEVGAIGVANDKALGTALLTMSDATTLRFLEGSINGVTNPITFSGNVSVDVGSLTRRLSGVITSAPGSVLDKSVGTGVLLLSGNNTYSGETNLLGGTIGLLSNTGLGTSTLNMSDLTTLDLMTGMTTASNPITLSGTGTVNISILEVKALTGVISGAGALKKTGFSTLNLGGANTYLGGTLLTEGAIGLNNNTGLGSGTLTMSNFTSLELLSGMTTASNSIILQGDAFIRVDDLFASKALTGVISGASGALFKEGLGGLVIGAQATYTGGTEVAQGKVSFSGTGALPIGGFVNVSLLATLDASGTNQSWGALSGDPLSSLVLGPTLSVGSNGMSTTFAGEITGNGVLTKVGSGVFTLTGINSYSGSTVVTAGELVGNTSSLPTDISNNALLTFNQTLNGTFSHVISGFGDLRVQGGGILNVTNTITQTTTTVENTGWLSLNGMLSSDVIVDAGGTLSGVGVVNGPVTVYGTVTPGNSIGTLTINGDYTAQNDSIYLVEISPTQSDTLIVDGQVTLEPGALVHVHPQFGSYAPDTIFNIITQTNGGNIFGSFADAILFLPSFKAEVQTLGDHVALLVNVVPLDDLPLNKYARKVAHCLEGIAFGSNSPLEPIKDELRFMTIERMNATMVQMLPTSFNTLDLVEEETLSQVRQTFSRQMNLASKPSCSHENKRYTVWTDVFSSYMKQKSSTYNEGYNAQPLGDVMGFNTTFDSGIYLGGGVGYAKDSVTWKRTGGNAIMHNGFAGLYAGGWLNCHLYAQGALVGAATSYDTDRFVKFVAFDFTTRVHHAQGHTRGLSGLGHFEVGGMFDPGVRLRPFGKIDYSYLHRDQFTETGGDGIALRVKSHNADVLRAEVGLEVLKCFKTVHQTLSSTPYLIVGDAYEWRFVGKSETASFESITCPMTAAGFFPTQNLPFLEAGLIETFGEDFASFSVNYRQEWGHEYVNRSWSGQIRFAF